MPVAAIAGVASAGLGLAGSAMSASAAGKAADAQAAAADKSIQFQRDSAQQARIDAYPWALQGAQALYTYMDALGIPRPQTPILPDLTQGPLGVGGTSTPAAPKNAIGDTSQQYIERRSGGREGSTERVLNPNYVAPGTQSATAPAAPNAIQSPGNIPMTAANGFQQTPGYQFQVQQGTQGVLNSLSALGMKNSGKALKSLDTFTQGVANQEYGNWLNRIAGVAGMGQTQTNATNSLSQNAATNIGQTYQDQGQARASGYVGQANAWSNGLNQVGNALGQIGGGSSNAALAAKYPAGTGIW